MERRDKTNYYLDIAEAVSERSTCLRRKFGAIVVKNDEIISTGYNGAPRGRQNCSDLDFCYRERMGVPRGQRYELCRSVHAEANAIISASRADLLGATLYLACHDAKTDKLDELEEKGWWANQVYPMAGNLQIVFYRKNASDRNPLLKVLVNEKEATLPLPSDLAPYYRWSDFRNFYLRKVAEGESVLSATKR